MLNRSTIRSLKLQTNTFRTFSTSRFILNTNNKKDNNNGEKINNELNDNNNNKIYSRRPLSSIPIGSEKYASQTMKRKPVEYLSWKSFLLFLTVGAGLTYLFKNEKEKLKLRKEAEANRGVGKPLIGGPFNLITSDNEKFTEKNLIGKFSIIYFGFTHCPDICPDELDKLGIILNDLKKKKNIELQPIFITCDPARDTPDVLKEYLSEFHPDIIGLTGDYDEIKKCCRNYRVYFSTPRDLKPGDDYLVDHSIFFYLMDPEGEFIDVLGRNYDADGAVIKIAKDINAYEPKDVRNSKKEGFLGWLYK
jgi:protein SCO1/2